MKNDCVFCEQALFEDRLIFENERFNIVASLGQITDGGYLLIFPKRHVSCIGEMKVPELEEMERLKDVAFSRLAAGGYGESVSLFEHGIVGQTINHAHLHLIPAVLGSLDDRLMDDFPGNLMMLSGALTDIREKYQVFKKPYLLWNPEKVYRTCWEPNAPKQYFRTVAAQLLKRPERADWKVMDRDIDRSLWEDTVARLSPYFSHPMVRAYEEFLYNLRNSRYSWKITEEGHLRTADNLGYDPIMAVCAFVKWKHCYPGAEMLYAREIGLPEELAIAIIKASDNSWNKEKAIQEIREDLFSTVGL